MSCNGCRVLRKGCNDNCILRQSLTAIDTPQAQANATVFVAKFFGRAGLLSFLSAVPEPQRPALFQSLLFEACGRTVNPVNGAVGLLWTGNWHMCQAAVAAVLRGGSIRAMPELFSGVRTQVTTDSDNASEAINSSFDDKVRMDVHACDLELGVISRSELKNDVDGSSRRRKRLRTMVSLEVSETTSLESGIDSACSDTDKKLLNLFL
ncbi:hypothetical protein QVD17_05789 [Tagetes erecta]|uniref:LOB domain-containing protein n=1 Tax=Tagetes erecta TaxID=13708 RepID=A0AAD8LCN4_TARER|nr:hypothetical protein QVD17_05789 [Tagetes erecta]